MRLLVTADLHYNHPKSRPLADELIDRMNAAGGDVLLVVGDTAVADGDAIEACLSRFRFGGPRLFVAGNHELWTRGADSYQVHSELLPARVRALGWQWIETEPFVAEDVAIVGSVGWYDYSFAQESLGIPRRFYEHKVSPGAAEGVDELSHLLEPADDISNHSRELIARWNDGKHVKLHRSDEAFLDELLNRMKCQLDSLADKPQIIAAIHHLPFRDLLPPPHGGQWDFAKAYLGSQRIGELLLRYPSVTRLFCGHSHWPAEARVGPMQAINLGSGYRWKTFGAYEV